MNRAEEFRKNYLTQTADMIGSINARNGLPKGFRYSSQQDFIVKEGIAYSDEPLTNAERIVLRPLLKEFGPARRPRLKQCYMNAFYLATTAKLREIPVHYAEGFGLNMIGANHAWGVLGQKPIDVTWREDMADKRFSVSALLDRIDWNITHNAYVGVVVPLWYLNCYVAKFGESPAILDNWRDKWPLLRNGLDEFKEEKRRVSCQR